MTVPLFWIFGSGTSPEQSKSLFCLKMLYFRCLVLLSSDQFEVRVVGSEISAFY